MAVASNLKSEGSRRQPDHKLHMALRIFVVKREKPLVKPARPLGLVSVLGSESSFFRNLEAVRSARCASTLTMMLAS